ncbi:MAG: Xaa-Pro peptidase family protein [bacterium]
MRVRARRILEAIPEGDRPEAIVLMNGTSALFDSTFRYVSGVTSGGYGGCAAVLRPGEATALVVSEMEAESASAASECEILPYKTREARQQILGTLLGGLRRIGLNAPAITWESVRALQSAAPDADFRDVSAAVTAARVVKDAREIDLIRRACAITSEVAAEIPAMLHEGVTEAEVAAGVARAIQDRGGSNAFSTIVGFGKNGSEPHYSPGDVPLRPGDLVLVDFGAKRDHYCSDITRMYLYGRATKEQRRMFDVVHDAQVEAVAMSRPGTPARDVHRHVTRRIDETEFAGRFIHGLGHSIGLDVHDGGGYSDASELVLEPGMVLTVEPGVYVSGVGGVRVEDTILVTDGAPEILTPVTKALVEVPA